jgi:hypothetical protein
VFWTPDGDQELHAARGIFSKNLVRLEKSTFLPVLGRFCTRAPWGGFERKMPIFCPRSQFLAGSSDTPQQFSPIAHNTYHLLCAFWTAGFTARPPDTYRVGVVYPNIPSIKSNGCILKRSARLYGDSMEPDHMAKYSLPMLTDLF